MREQLSWLATIGVPIALASGWVLRLVFDRSLHSVLLSLAGLGIVVIAIILMLISTKYVRYWDEENNILVDTGPFTVEVSILVLFDRIPIGITLSHSAKRVLLAMHDHYHHSRGGAVTFILARPVGNSRTRLGFKVTRRGLRIPLADTFERLRDRVVEDAHVLRAAMNAAYPHVAIAMGNLADSVLADSGGIEEIEAV